MANGDLWSKALRSGVDGYRESGRCMVFAANMGRTLRSQGGVRAKVLYYTWRQGFRTGNHAVVVYSYNGSWYAGDNYSGSPRRLASTGDASSAVALAKAYSDEEVYNARFAANF